MYHTRDLFYPIVNKWIILHSFKKFKELLVKKKKKKKISDQIITSLKVRHQMKFYLEMKTNANGHICLSKTRHNSFLAKK